MQKIRTDLRVQFKELSGINWENSQGEPDIEYVEWLEKELLKLRTAVASNNSFVSTQQVAQTASKGEME